MFANTGLAGFIKLLFLLWALSFPGSLRAQAGSALPIMPLPAHAVRDEGEFLIDGNFGIALKGYNEPRLERARQRFLDLLSSETGIPLWREAVVNQPHFIIQTAGPSAAVQQIGILAIARCAEPSEAGQGDGAGVGPRTYPGFQSFSEK